MPLETLKKVGVPLTTLPETFTPHKKVGEFYQQRAKMIETGQGIDWALGEQLAVAHERLERRERLEGGVALPLQPRRLEA